MADESMGHSLYIFMANIRVRELANEGSDLLKSGWICFCLLNGVQPCKKITETAQNSLRQVID